MSFKRILNNISLVNAGNMAYKATKILDNYNNQYRMSNYPNFPVVKVFLGAIGFLGTGFGIYTAFKKPIHKYLSSEGSNVAAGIVNSPEVKKSVKSSVNILIEDSEVTDKLQGLVTVMINQIINEPWFMELLTQKGSKLVEELCDDENVNNKIAKLFIDIFARKDVSDSLNKLISDACQHPTNQEEVAKTIKEVIARNDVQKEMSISLRKIAVGAFFG